MSRARLAFTLVVAITLVMTLPLVWGGIRVGQDAATQFYPWYDLLGERLRSGGVPEWNPHQFSGTPLAADPQSGWGYLLAMLLFTLLPLEAAVVLFLFGHLLLANTGAFLLARRLGLGLTGAVTAGSAYAFTGVIYGRSASGPASFEACSWLPWLPLGFEIALQARSWRGRIAGWALCGLAISQLLAAWIGQLSYYGLLLLGAYALYRTVIVGKGETRDESRRSIVPTAPPSSRSNVPTLLMHGAAVLVIGFGLGAVSLLPRLEYNPVSNVAGGEYSGEPDITIGGSSSESVVGGLFGPSLYYPGAATLVLVVAGVIFGGRGHAIPFWLVTAVGAIVLTIPMTTPLHWLLYRLLPRFEDLHSHWPERVILITYLGMAIVAGVGAQALAERRAPVLRLIAVAVPFGILAGFALAGATISLMSIGAVVAVSLVALAPIALPVRWSSWIPQRIGRTHGGRTAMFRPAVSALLLLIVLTDALLTNEALARDAPFGGFVRVDLSEYLAPTPAARFLQERQAEDGPFRYAGYDPAIGTIEDGESVLYRYQFPDPRTRDLLVNNRASVLGLEDTQGYNPIQVQRYVEFIAAMNGAPQEYHGTDIYPPALDSPLLDLLNLRYLVIPVAFDDDRNDLSMLTMEWDTVYQDDTVRIVENPTALPRAWVVHEARQVEVSEALPLLSSGDVDPRQVALIEGDDDEFDAVMATLLDPAASNGEQPVTAIGYRETGDADHLRLTVSSDTPGLLVLSEVTYPAWSATVDGEPATVLTANQAFRAVPIPAGEVVVELRYESAATSAGLVISLGTIVALVAAVCVSLGRVRSWVRLD